MNRDLLGRVRKDDLTGLGGVGVVSTNPLTGRRRKPEPAARVLQTKKLEPEKALKANPYPDGDGKFSTKENDADGSPGDLRGPYVGDKVEWSGPNGMHRAGTVQALVGGTHAKVKTNNGESLVPLSQLGKAKAVPKEIQDADARHEAGF